MPSFAQARVDTTTPSPNLRNSKSKMSAVFWSPLKVRPASNTVRARNSNATSLRTNKVTLAN